MEIDFVKGLWPYLLHFTHDGAGRRGSGAASTPDTRTDTRTQGQQSLGGWLLPARLVLPAECSRRHRDIDLDESQHRCRGRVTESAAHLYSSEQGGRAAAICQGAGGSWDTESPPHGAPLCHHLLQVTCTLLGPNNTDLSRASPKQDLAGPC